MFKTIVGNIQLTKLLSNQQGNISPARIVKCHPSLPLVLIATDDRNLSMWSLVLYLVFILIPCNINNRKHSNAIKVWIVLNHWST